MPISSKRIWSADPSCPEERGGWRTGRPYAACRIPGIVRSARGTLLLYCEARDTLSDWARIDLLLFRSEDGGETFSDPVVLASGDDRHPTVNNPVLIAAGSGELFLLFCRDYSVDGGDVFLRRSRDDGKTWSDPVDLMDRTRPELHNAFAFGPGHGIETADGTLLSPVWFVPKSAGSELRSHHPAAVSSFRSEDGGESWSLGEILPASEGCPDPNETAAARTSDGGVYFNVRLTGAGVRGASWSKDGQSGFSPLVPVPEMPDPTCMGSAANAEWRGVPLILAVNCDSTSERKNLTLRASSDDGKTWPRSLVIDPGDAGYSDLCVIPGEDPTVSVLYEKRWGTELWFAKIPLGELWSKNAERL